MYRHLVEQFNLMAYPIAALVIFVAVFLLVIVRALRLPRDLSAFASMPLDLGNRETPTSPDSTLASEHDHAAR
jgi:hypothetical protein